MAFWSGGQRPPILHADTPKGPWGGGADNGGGEGGGSGNGGGPRNPWSLPPGGRRGAPQPSALDEFLRRARGGGGGGGFGGLPQGGSPRLWLIGVGVLLAAWVILTSFHSIGQGQRGVVTFLGRYQNTLEPGIRMTLPAPFAAVTNVDVQNNRLEDFPDGGGENLMLTADQNIVDLAYSVRWTISNPEDYVFQIANQKETVRSTAESAMREVVANVKLDDALGPGRSRIEAQVQDRMQVILDGYHSGVRIQGVALKQVDPPERVNDAFKDVTAAQQDAVAVRNQAQSYAQQKLALAQGAAAEFDKVYEQYKLAPDVTKRRLYYETMEQVLAKSDKTVVEAPGVMPYLPLDRARRAPDAEAAVQAGAGQ